MKTEIEIPETLHGAIKYFSTGDNAHDILVSRRWPNGVNCPHCAATTVTFLSARKVWQCKGCRKQFSVKVGTIFEDSPVKLDKWLSAFWLIVNAKNGISSCELGRALGVTQKTAWFILHRIRLAIQTGSIEKFGGTVEVDETFIGGAARFMHKSRRKAKGIKTGPCHLTAVQGLLERHNSKGKSRIVLKVLKNRREREATKHVKEYILKDATVYTDKLASYQNLGTDFEHKVIDHAEKYVDGVVHTNGLENFWCLLKRGIKGTYVSIEPFHLFRYLDEQAFRFNERTDTDKGRFVTALSGIVGKSLSFAKLTGKLESGEGLPEAAAGTW
jgi:transposase-like protein